MDILKADLLLSLTSDLKLKRGVVSGFMDDENGIARALVILEGDTAPSLAYVYYNCQHWIYSRNFPGLDASFGGASSFCPEDEIVVFVNSADLFALGLYDKDGRDTLLHSPCWPVFPPEMSFVVLPISADDFNVTWSTPFFNDPPSDPYDFVDAYPDIYGNPRSAGTLVTLQQSFKRHGRLITMHGDDQFVAHTLAEFFSTENEHIYLLPSAMPEVKVAGRTIGYAPPQNAFLLGGIPFGIDFTRYGGAFYEAQSIAASANSDGDLALRMYIKSMTGKSGSILQLGIMITVVMPFPCVRGLASFGPSYADDVLQHLYGADTPYVPANFPAINAGYMSHIRESGLFLENSNTVKVYAINGGYFTYSWGWRVQPDDPHMYVYNITTEKNETGQLRPSVTVTREDNVFSKAQPSTAFGSHVGNGHSPIAIGGGNVLTGKQVVISDTGGNPGTNDGHILYCHNGQEISRFRHRATITSTENNWSEVVHESAVTHFHYARPDLGFYLFTELTLTEGYSSSLNLQPMFYLLAWSSDDAPAHIADFNSAISDNVTARFYSWVNGVKTLHSTTVIPYTCKGARAMATQGVRFRAYPGKESTHETEKSLGTPASTGPLAAFTFCAWNWIDNAAVDHLQPIYNLAQCIGLPGAEFPIWWYFAEALTKDVTFSIEKEDHYAGVSGNGSNAVTDGYTMFKDGAMTCYTPIYVPFKGNMAPAITTISHKYALITFRDPFSATASYELFSGPPEVLQRLKEAINPDFPEKVTFTKNI